MEKKNIPEGEVGVVVVDSALLGLQGVLLLTLIY